MPTPTKLAAALSSAATLPSDDNELVEVTLRASDCSSFDLGGRSGRIVTISDHPKVHKGFRLLKVDAVDLSDASAKEVSDAIGAARRKGNFVATFAGGRPMGGGGWLAVQAIGKSKAAAEAAAARRTAAERERAVVEHERSERDAAERAASEQAAAEKAAAVEKAAAAAAAEKAAAAAAAAEKAGAVEKAANDAKREASEKEMAAAAAAEAARSASQAVKIKEERVNQRAAWDRAAKAAPTVSRAAFKALPRRNECAEPQQTLMAALCTRPLMTAEAAAAEDGDSPNECETGPCDKCDGKHATSKCPFFKKARDQHKDAFEHYSGDTDQTAARINGGDSSSSKARRAPPLPPPLPPVTRVVAQPGDGSCLFHSLAYGMRLAGRGNRTIDADSVRGTVAAFIEQNPEAELGGSPLSSWISWESGMVVAKYCARMRTVGEWGGAIEMAVASRIWETTIHVYERHSGGFRLISCFDSADVDASAHKVVRVLYSGRCHYDALDVPAA